MKIIILISLLFSSFVSAQEFRPVTCESIEKLDGMPLLRFKINQKVNYEDTRKNIWKHHLIGVTPSDAAKFFAYGSGSVSPTRIGMTFIKKDFVIGKAEATFKKKKGIYEGTAYIDGAARNQELEIECKE